MYDVRVDKAKGCWVGFLGPGKVGRGMRCEIICVGTELLLGDILNTNAQFLARGLSRLGLDLYVQTVAGDNPGRLAQAVFAAMGRAQILLFTGGLGPTQDDITKEVVSRCFGRQLVMDQGVLAGITAYYESTRRPMPKSNQKQALVPEGGVVLPNPHGTAPGVALFSDQGHSAFLMPGPPREMQPMFTEQVVPRLQQYSTGGLFSKAVRVVGLGESRMAELLFDLMENGTNPTLAPYAKDMEAMVRVTAKARDQQAAEAISAPVIAEIKGRLGRHVYGVDVPSLESVIAGLLQAAGLRLCILEAGSAGRAASRLEATALADEVCSLSLSAPSFGQLASLLGQGAGGQRSPSQPEQALLQLCQAASRQLHASLVLGIQVAEGQAYAALLSPFGNKTHSQNLPSRGLDHRQVMAVQAAFDLLRHSLLDQGFGA